MMKLDRDFKLWNKHIIKPIAYDRNLSDIQKTGNSETRTQMEGQTKKAQCIHIS